jgi:hypothetical protein
MKNHKMALQTYKRLAPVVLPYTDELQPLHLAAHMINSLKVGVSYFSEPDLWVAKYRGFSFETSTLTEAVFGVVVGWDELTKREG